MCKTMSSTNKDKFPSSFSVWMPFISFSSLIALAKPFSTMLSRSSENGHFCFIFLRGKFFNLSTLSTVLAVGLPYIGFIMLRYILSVLSLLRIFTSKGFCILSSTLS